MSNHLLLLLYIVLFVSSISKKPRFLQLLIDTTVEGIEENMRIKLDMKRLTQLKKMSYKGSTSSSVIRSAKDKVKREYDCIVW